MIVTKIEIQKNNKKKYSVFINNEFAFGIDEIDLIYFKLKENEPISKEKYEYIINNLLLKKAKNTALRFLSYKMRTEKEIRQKLKKEEFPENVIDKIIKILIKYNYINDTLFSKYFIKDNINIKGYGIFKIEYELKTLGISEDIYRKYLDLFSIDEIEKASQLIEKKIKNKNNINFKEKQKLYSYLVRRGFSFDAINRALNNLSEEYYG